ncbi:DUF3617 family protein [Sphingosinicella sp. LHD-64]|uniref:DUF3617 domain-containing protein n=1 Tax=Sphingosinicella sp. LHD-64 TaxID=3072139 RepID=UPI00280E1463|nr:DUF3617 family protein [Sphingosinicella sp. LHD-64]MDQ8758061.1 DUF3617 family protein [Sphingosinicella sp. LHD-64]
MRKLACIPLLFVAACGDGEAEKNAAAPATAASLAAGQWELTSEVTAFRAADGGAPRIDTPVGTRATQSVCVGAGQPPIEFFAGDGFTCTTGASYIRNGRMNVTASCTRDGLEGSIQIMADGTFQADSAEFNRNIGTMLSTDGDVEITARVDGRRTGDCTPGTESGGNNAATAG